MVRVNKFVVMYSVINILGYENLHSAWKRTSEHPYWHIVRAAYPSKYYVLIDCLLKKRYILKHYFTTKKVEKLFYSVRFSSGATCKYLIW